MQFNLIPFLTALQRSFTIIKLKEKSIIKKIQTGFIFVFLILISACRTQPPVISKFEETGLSELKNEQPQELLFESSMISPSLVPLTSSEEEKILNIIRGMSLKEKIGQLFILDLKNRDEDTYFTRINNDLRNFIENFKPGGVILFSANINSNQQVIEFISDLQLLLKIPLFVAVDQEGGRVSRVSRGSEMNVLNIPSHEVLGKLNDTEITRQVGNIIGKELISLGFNMNLAPVADINSYYKNPVLGDRSFSKNTEIVSSMVKSFVQGLQESGVCSVIKHFPGHGSTDTDPHSGAVSINLSLSEIRKREFLPFTAGISQGAVGVMTAHIQTPQIVESDNLPATLSPFFIGDILRNELGYTGLVISDSFSMAAIKDFWPPEDSAAAFIIAGGDIILRPSNVEAAVIGLMEFIENGSLTEERIDKSVFRILAAKYRFGFFSGDVTSDQFNLEAGQLFLDKILSLAF